MSVLRPTAGLSSGGEVTTQQRPCCLSSGPQGQGKSLGGSDCKRSKSPWEPTSQASSRLSSNTEATIAQRINSLQRSEAAQLQFIKINPPSRVDGDKQDYARHGN